MSARKVRKALDALPVTSKVDIRPSTSFWLLLLTLHYLQRRRVMMAACVSWLVLKAGHALVASPKFQSRILLMQSTRNWPPCDLDRPETSQKLPLLWRWLDWLPTQLGLDDVKSFPGIRNVKRLEVLRKRRIGAWLVEPEHSPSSPSKSNNNKKQRKSGVVMYFRGRSGHRGTRSRLRFYERIRRDPLGLSCVTFDGDDDEVASERASLVSAHAVWSTITRPPYDFETDSVVIWGSTLGCCSAANLCLYLMRRGTPPAALVLETPATSFPKLIASRFAFLGEEVQMRVETFLKDTLVHRYDLEKRIRSICSFGLSVPVLVVSAQHEHTVPLSHAERIANIASALVASKRIKHITRPVTRQELISDPVFIAQSASFVHDALADARMGSSRRSFSVDFGSSPATYFSDQTAEDRLFEESADPPFGL